MRRTQIIGGQYEWEQLPDGTFLVRDVEVFAPCERRRRLPTGETVTLKFDDAWIAQSVKNAEISDADGHLPPLHLHHHDDEGSLHVTEVGAFKVTSFRTMQLKGQRVMVAVADLVLTDVEAFERIKNKRLRYRSVEADFGGRSIKAMALLDHMPPHHELPMLTLRDVTKDVAADHEERELASTGVAFSNEGHTIVFQEVPQMSQRTVKSVVVDDEGRVQFELEDGEVVSLGRTGAGDANFESDEGGDGGDEGGSSSASLSDIDLGSIEATADEWASFIKQAQEIQAALSGDGGDAAAEDAPAEDPVEPDASGPAEPMDADADEDEDDEKFSAESVEDPNVRALLAQQAQKLAEQESKLITFQREQEARKAADELREAVDASMVRLAGRSGSEADQRAELEDFGRKYGVEAMNDHVERLCSAIPELPVRGSDTSRFYAAGGAGMGYPDAVTKYDAVSAEIGALARELFQQYDPKSCNGMPVERFLALNIPGADLDESETTTKNAEALIASPRRS